MADLFKPSKGMIKDTGRMDQVDGSYRDALNLIVDDLKLNVANEYGTISVGGLNIFVTTTAGVQNVAISAIGQIALLDDNFIIFGYGEYYAPAGINVTVSTIHKVNVPQRTATLLYYTTNVVPTSPGTINPTGHLNFDVTYPVTAELRESPIQEEIVYFTDNKSTFITDPDTNIQYVSEYNPPRVFNITKQEQSIAVTGDPSNLYGNFSRTEFLNLFMDSGRIPEFDDIVILKGGGVITGAYYLGVGYADNDRTETNVLVVSNPVYIVPANDDSFPREMISGAPNGTQTDKSIQWKLTNINTEYKYIVPYVVQYSGKVKSVYKLENVNITSPNVNVVYSGLEKVASSAIEEAVIDKVRYLTAKSITQLDNKLYAANLTSRPDLGYQRFANNIKIQPMVELVTPFDPRRYDIYTLNEGYSQLVYPDPSGGAVENPVYTDSTYEGGTYYGPMGSMTSNISYTMFKGVDGVSEAYVTSIIIPIQQGQSAGYRDPNLLFKKKGYRRGEVYAFYISFVLKDGSETYAYHIPGRDKVDAFEDDWTAFETGVGATLGAISFGIKTGEIRSYDPNARVYQYFDTSYMGTVPSVSFMGYWQNLNEVYPTNENFEVWGVNSDGTSSQLSTLANTNIRHHKMPSNHNSAFSHVVRDTYFGDIPLDSPSYTSNADEYRVFNDQVRILGIQLENLKIPKFILSQVQGYKVYYAKRTQGNKTIIGQSGAHPSTSYLAANLSNNDKNAGQGPYFNIWSLDGDLKYGGIAISDALWIQNKPDLVSAGFSNELRNITFTSILISNPSGQINYIGNPVFKFHDFNLLRKRPTLATATHIDIQYICLMESWRGGYKGAQRTQVADGAESFSYLKYYRSFRSGIGEDTFSWVHEDLGNMINYSVNIADPVNYNNTYDNPGPKVLWGNVYVASRYAMPGSFNDYTGQRYDQGITWYQKYNGIERYLGDINKFPNIAIGQSTLLSNTQTILMIEPEGATYVNGLSILKSATANGFKGATYLYNAFGESCIAISLASGLPNLGGYRTNEWSYIGLSNLMWSLPIYSGIIAGGSSPTNTPGVSGPVFDLVMGHDINYNKGFDTPQVVVWPVVENTFLQALATGHSSLRQPYSMSSPAIGASAVNISYTFQTTGTSAGPPPSGISLADNQLVIEGTATGSGSLASIAAGASATAYAVPPSFFQYAAFVTGTTATVTSVEIVNGYYVIGFDRNFAADTGLGVNITITQPASTSRLLVNNDPKTRPNTYLINLCSNKTDVFEPFDKQELVWTGFYKRLNVDIETGVDLDNGSSYYGTASSYSGPIFGGDTYICRYSYRTTSNLYGLGRFRKGMNAYNGDAGAAGTLGSIIRSASPYIWGDVPLNMNIGKTPSYLRNIFDGYGDYNVLFWGGQPDDPLSSTIEGAGDESQGMRRNSILDKDNWSAMGYEVFTTIYQYMVESDDNINYRHAGDPEAGVSELNSMYFDRYVAADVLYRSPLGDLTKMDNILYEDHYSALQDIRVPIAFPKETTNTLAFPNRVIRSATQDGNFNDTYRYFLGIQYKDFAVNKGPITNIFNLKALLYIHTEKSLFRTKGKQNIELGDATQAYIGSGDLFAQEPDEFIQSTEGYNGLYNKMGSLVTKDGYIFVARKSRKIFLVKDEVIDLTLLGINAWARENIPFALEVYGWDPDYTNTPTDAPTGDFGFLVTYDPLFKRTLITKRELVPTQTFIDGFTSGAIRYDRATGQFKNIINAVLPVVEGSLFERGGWTISFSNSLSIWASRHSYIPSLYAYNSKFMYSFDTMLTPGGLFSNIYEHSDLDNPGRFYGTVYNFEIDCIFTVPVNAVFSGFKYTADVFSKSNTRLAAEQQFSPGFTSFYAYNTTQISGEVDLVYLNNIRKTDNNWNVNAFRDLSKIVSNSGLAVGQINVQGIPYTSTSVPTSAEPMFLSEGIINSNYIDSNKPWYEQRKFVDKFLGIRLIANNLSKNLINLYTVTAALRVSPR